MAKQNSINRFTQDLTIDPGASGDSCIQFNINTGAEFRIGVDDTDDSFRISQGNALGTNDTFIMTDVGERTMPLQPAFAAYLASVDSGVIGSGANYIIGTNVALTEIFDQGGDFDNTTGIFTAPTTGRYRLMMGALFDDLDALVTTSATININTSNRTYSQVELLPTSVATAAGQYLFNGYCFADMDAADIARFRCNGLTLGALKVIDLYGTATHPYTWVGGCLIC